MMSTKPLGGPSKPIQRLTPPFDTGKVKIGLAHVPVQSWSPGRDAYRLQSALLASSGTPLVRYGRLRSFLRSIFMEGRHEQL